MSQQMKSLKLVFTLFFILLLSAWLFLGSSHQRKVTISVVSNENNSSVIKAARLYLEHYNKTHPKVPFRINLQEYNDENDKELAVKIANTISSDRRSVSVIGHPWSSTSLAAGPVYAEHKLPVLAVSATNPKVTAQSEYHFRSIFNDKLQGQFLAKYGHKILNKKRVFILHTDKAYATYLARVFLKSSNRSGMVVMDKLLFKKPVSKSVSVIKIKT
jgi:ABC-type branched-chain amino acid transport systems, periplasmic component